MLRVVGPKILFAHRLKAQSHWKKKTLLCLKKKNALEVHIHSTSHMWWQNPVTTAGCKRKKKSSYKDTKRWRALMVCLPLSGDDNSTNWQEKKSECPSNQLPFFPQNNHLPTDSSTPGYLSYQGDAKSDSNRSKILDNTVRAEMWLWPLRTLEKKKFRQNNQWGLIWSR